MMTQVVQPMMDGMKQMQTIYGADGEESPGRQTVHGGETGETTNRGAPRKDAAGGRV